MGDLFRPDLQQLRDLESKHEALASPLQAAAVLLALALEDPFSQRSCLNQSHLQLLAIGILTVPFSLMNLGLKYLLLKLNFRHKNAQK
jgi:hypothetical protein